MITTTPQANPYLIMPLDRVRSDALYGVSAARTAWRARDPEAAEEMGKIILPGHEHELIRCPQPTPAVAGQKKCGSKTRRTKQ
jgi:hypothetical protein